MKDLSTLKYFRGIEVARNVFGLYLSHRKYALDIISKIGLFGSKLALLQLNKSPIWQLKKVIS